MGLLVVDPGFFTTVQDLGRPGARSFGVPLGGAFDRESLALAVALAGDEPGPAALETTLRGGVYEARCDLGIALAGAAMAAAIVAGDGSRRPIPVPSSAWLRRGERIELGPPEHGARTYLATPGGFRTAAWLGSRSAERPVRKGDVLPAGPSRLEARRPTIDRLELTDAVRILPGPDWSLLADPDAMTSSRFRVGTRSDRMGLRLEGESVAVAPTPDRLSAPVTPGAIQAAGGRLIVLGVACGTMGGYPHVAQVISADLDRLGRLRPGDPIAFRLVEQAEARSLDREGRMRVRELSLRVAAAARDGLG
jgi:antagonist of KipI